MQELNIESSATILANASTVYVNGSLEPRLRCVAIESSVGPVPGKALIMLGSCTTTEKSPRTLMSTSDYGRWKYGSRVKVLSDGDIAFLGTMMQRHDSGAADAPMWFAFDDRWLLSRLLVRGCFINDGGVAKWISRYLPEFNPGGWWNCVGYKVGEAIIPLFNPYAQARPGALLTQQFTELKDGEITAWTPRRAIQYLQYIANVDGPQGWNPNRNGIRSLLNSTRLHWSMTLDGIDGTAGKGGVDPLDSKLQTTNYIGMNMLQAVCEVLKSSGTHELGLEISNEDDSSQVMFYPRNGSSDDLEILVRRGGQVAEANVAIDFDLMEDASEVSEAVLIEGQERKVECQVKFNPDDGSDYGDNPLEDLTNTIKPAWTDQDEIYFAKVIWGAAAGSAQGTYAMIPAADGAEPTVICDGTGSRPLAEACTPDAIALARQLYPDVYMTYQISTANLDKDTETSVFSGENHVWDTRMNYPVVNSIRPSFHEQLTKLFLNNTKLADRVPVRIEVLNDDKWCDSPFLNGFMTSPTQIRINGMVENADMQNYCLYSGSLLIKPFETMRKGIRINIALPLDHRVEGYAELSDQDVSDLDPSINVELGGKLLAYELNPAFIHEFRMGSWPRPNSVKAEDGDLENSELDAAAAAERTLQLRKHPEKRSSWVFPGIRLDYQPGRWVKRIKVVGQSADDIDYKVEAIIPSVVHDFLRQETRVGGLLSHRPTPTIDESQTSTPSKG